MIRLGLLLLCLVSAGCAVKPLTGPQTYQDGSMSFSVPAGWKVTMHGKGGGSPDGTARSICSPRSPTKMPRPWSRAFGKS